jgi:hypothetical protein
MNPDGTDRGVVSLERWTARRARSMAVPTGVNEQKNLAIDSPEVMADARAHWADHWNGTEVDTWPGTAALNEIP